MKKMMLISLAVLFITSLCSANTVREHFVITVEGDTLWLIELIDDTPPDSLVFDNSYCQIDSNIFMTYISTYDESNRYRGLVLVLLVLGDFVWPSRINDLIVE